MPLSVVVIGMSYTPHVRCFMFLLFMVCWVDRLFRTMGLRHLVVLKSDHVVVGIVTRANLLKHELQMHEYGDVSPE